MSNEVEQAAEHNMQHFLEHGPGLSYSYRSYVLARRPSTGEILLGGLGAMGVGQMWFTETEDYSEYPGYHDAEIVD